MLLFTLDIFIPHFQNRHQHAQHSARNLMLALVNAAISTLFLLFIISHVLSWTNAHQLGLLNQISISAQISFIIAIISIDLWQNIWHRANHALPLLWNFHQVHHSDKEMDASTGLRFHPVKIIYSHTARLAITQYWELS